MHEEDDALEDELDQAPELSGRPLSPVREGQETLGRRRRAVLVLQPGGGDVPTLRHRQSAMSLIGLSPAQVCLTDGKWQPSSDGLTAPLACAYTSKRLHLEGPRAI